MTFVVVKKIIRTAMRVDERRETRYTAGREGELDMSLLSYIYTGARVNSICLYYLIYIPGSFVLEWELDDRLVGCSKAY